MEPEYRYCTSADGTRISYSTMGTTSSPALLFVTGWEWPQAWAWEWHVPKQDFDAGLAEDHMVVHFDRRGVGASQRQVDDLSLDAQVADVAAVADAVADDGFNLVGMFDGGLPAMGYAARFPQRVRCLVLWCTYLRGTSATRMDRVADLARSDWELARMAFASLILPEGPVDAQRRYQAMLHDNISPEMAGCYMNMQLDVSRLARSITSPTLVLQPRGAGEPWVRDSQAVAEAIPGARLAVVDYDTPVERLEIVQDLLGIRSDSGKRYTKRADAAKPAASGTAIILFADIVDSTALTEKLGDAAFRERARTLDAALRTTIADAGGVAIEGKLLGDGVLATFSAANQAIGAALRCATQGEEAGLPLHLGLHAGDVIREENNVFGGAVNVASRISGLSAPGEVLVSDIVRGLARTSSSVTFEDCGEHRLKGVSDAVRTYRVRSRD